ncbi:hypothetical protein ACSBLW_09455 [Thioclava sp. FR2]|uniref:hypothetical protein n=1 Tax=Thioclava sp. FR2 TaxID=3445780 RepID=UPI003EBE3A76
MTVSTVRYHLLDPVAFSLALVLAPLLVAVVFFWVILIPVFAVPFGMPVYLIFGTPMLLILVTRIPVTPWHFGLCGFALELALVLFHAATEHLIDYDYDLGVLLLWGLPIAPLWTATFARLYRYFYNSIYRAL